MSIQSARKVQSSMFPYQRALLPFGLLLLLSACHTVKTIQSPYSAPGPAIDANIGDWSGGVRAVDKGGFSLGISNDEDYLYLAFLSRDQGVTQQIMMGGLMIWLDSAGGKDASQGIKYPVGLMGSDAFVGMRPAGRGGMPGNPAQAQAMEDRIQEASAQMLKEVKIVNKIAEEIAAGNAASVMASGSYDYGILTFELRIPLHSVVGLKNAAPTTIVGVGLVVPEMDREAPREQMRGRGEGMGPGSGGPPGGMGGGPPGGRGGGPPGGMGGGPPGGRGGGPPGGMANERQSFNHWFSIELSAGV